jgi:hypothetical protein
VKHSHGGSLVVHDFYVPHEDLEVFALQFQDFINPELQKKYTGEDRRHELSVQQPSAEIPVEIHLSSSLLLESLHVCLQEAEELEAHPKVSHQSDVISDEPSSSENKLPAQKGSDYRLGLQELYDALLSLVDSENEEYLPDFKSLGIDDEGETSLKADEEQPHVVQKEMSEDSSERSGSSQYESEWENYMEGTSFEAPQADIDAMNLLSKSLDFLIGKVLKMNKMLGSILGGLMITHTGVMASFMKLSVCHPEHATSFYQASELSFLLVSFISQLLSAMQKLMGFFTLSYTLNFDDEEMSYAVQYMTFIKKLATVCQNMYGEYMRLATSEDVLRKPEVFKEIGLQYQLTRVIQQLNVAGDVLQMVLRKVKDIPQQAEIQRERASSSESATFMALKNCEEQKPIYHISESFSLIARKLSSINREMSLVKQLLNK